MVNLLDVAWEEGKDLLWMERLVRASGMLGQIEKENEGVKVIVTKSGWAVWLDAKLMREAIRLVHRRSSNHELDESISLPAASALKRSSQIWRPLQCPVQPPQISQAVGHVAARGNTLARRHDDSDTISLVFIP